jgi:hypothetical protein
MSRQLSGASRQDQTQADQPSYFINESGDKTARLSEEGRYSRYPYYCTMFSRAEASRIRHEFWTAFGRYMSPVPSAEGMKINWVNYHTGLKDVYFRMNAGNQSATISISIEHHDPDIQQLYFEQFLEMKDMLHATLEEEWEWQLHMPAGDGKMISSIYKELSQVCVLNKDHWPDLISFFKPRIIALDSFWENARWGFEALK